MNRRQKERQRQTKKIKKEREKRPGRTAENTVRLFFLCKTRNGTRRRGDIRAVPGESPQEEAPYVRHRKDPTANDGKRSLPPPMQFRDVKNDGSIKQ